jgi:hypothetical protein
MPLFEDEPKEKKKKGINRLSDSLADLAKVVEALDKTEGLEKLNKIITSMDALGKANGLDKLLNVLEDINKTTEIAPSLFTKLNSTLEKLSKIDVNVKYDVQQINGNFEKLKEIKESLVVLAKAQNDLTYVLEQNQLKNDKNIQALLKLAENKKSETIEIKKDEKENQLLTNILTNINTTNQLLTQLLKPKKVKVLRDLNGAITHAEQIN